MVILTIVTSHVLNRERMVEGKTVTNLEPSLLKITQTHEILILNLKLGSKVRIMGNFVSPPLSP